MKTIRIMFCMFAVCMLWACGDDGKTPAYKNAKLSIEKRVDDLLGRMTLEEKVGQLCSRYDNFTPADVENKALLDSFFTMIPSKPQPPKTAYNSQLPPQCAILARSTNLHF